MRGRSVGRSSVLHIYIVATHLRGAQTFVDAFIASLRLNVPVKEFWMSVNIWQSYDKNLVAHFLLHHSIALALSKR